MVNTNTCKFKQMVTLGWYSKKAKLELANWTRFDLFPIKIITYSKCLRYSFWSFYSYETENGISATQQGAPKQIDKEVAVVVQGNYQYDSPDGLIKIEYVADENGYQPSGNVLPTPPPIPAAIVRLLEYIAAHPQPVQTGKP